MILNSLDIPSHAFNAYNGLYIDSINNKNCVSILISRSGANPTMLQAGYQLAKHGHYLIALAGSQRRSLELICSSHLNVFSVNNKYKVLVENMSIKYLIEIMPKQSITKKQQKPRKKKLKISVMLTKISNCHNFQTHRILQSSVH